MRVGRLTIRFYFDISRIMEINDAASAFHALSQTSRLEIMRTLISAGPDGLNASMLAQSLKMPASTTSFHLRELSQAGMISARKNGRQLIYTADYGGLRRLIDFLMADCCQGDPRLCGPYVVVANAPIPATPPASPDDR